MHLFDSVDIWSKWWFGERCLRDSHLHTNKFVWEAVLHCFRLLEIILVRLMDLRVEQKVLDKVGKSFIIDVGIEGDHHGLIPAEDKIFLRNLFILDLMFKIERDAVWSAHVGTLFVVKTRNARPAVFVPALLA